MRVRFVFCPTPRLARAWVGLFAALYLPALLLSALPAQADPPLPTFGPTVYNVAVPTSGITGTASTSGTATANATAINNFITFCSSHGGGTVEIPAGSYTSGQLNMKSNVNLKIDTGAVLLDTNINTSLIKCSSGSNMEISGGGIIDGGATKTVGSTNLVDMRNVTTLAIVGVSIENSGHEHLVPINDNNLTISGVTIADPGTLAANQGAYLVNTDGIDFAGTNVLIKNCSVTDGDDDIVAKPAGNACTNVTITGCTIGSGHGISVGGGIAAGVTNMLVTNCTMNGTTNGFRVKAADMPMTSGDAGGGTAHPLNNVKIKNVTMTNVQNPLIVDSFYDNGDNNFPTSPTSSASYSYSSPTALAADSTTPVWQNIALENITATGASNAGEIFGLNVSTDGSGTANAMNGIAFSNVKISASSHMNLWYGDNVDVTGLSITEPDSLANASPVKGASTADLTNLTSTGPPLLPGDFNRDGKVTVADIAAMMNALANLQNYQTANSLSAVQMEVIADLNDDFAINNADVQALITQIANAGGGGSGDGSITAVPEPPTLALCFAGLMCWAGACLRKTRLPGRIVLPRQAT